jgi:hypothetical protein
MSAPTLYLAGKIGKNDWRHKLIPGLRDHEWGTGAINTEAFSYVGPFFVSCDHGCRHWPNLHGAVGEECGPDLTQRDVIASNNTALDAADLLLAYITAPDCYGTLVEIGWALKGGARVVLAFAPGIPVQDFWYGALQSNAIYTDIRECCLPAILAAELHKTKPLLRWQAE